LAFIYAYTKINRRPPAERDMQRFFEVTPPSAHRMVKELETKGSSVERPGRRAVSRSSSLPTTSRCSDEHTHQSIMRS
ncbi:MAG: hypothetical protein AAF645_22425, partial [Myxococcota bacterium]